MVVLQAYTREEARQAVGFNLGAVYVSDASANGTTTTVVDNSLATGTTDEHRGKWVRLTSGGGEGQISQVTSSAIATFVTTLTIAPAFTGTTPTLAAVTYELWDAEWHPATIDNFITQTMHEATGKFFFWDEDLSLHAGSDVRRFDIPSNIVAIKDVQYRSKVTERVLHACDAIWTTIDADATAVADAEVKRRGTASQRLTVAAGLAAGDNMAVANITSVDLSKYSHIECWIRVSTAVVALDLRLHLTDGTTTQFTGDIPAISANVWTFVRLNLRADNQAAVPTGGFVFRAITRIQFEFNANAATIQIWIDDVKVTMEESQVWSALAKKYWWIDKEAQDLVLDDQASSDMGYALMKLVGYDKPALPTTDGAAIEVDPSWVIAKATELAFQSKAGGSASDPDQYRTSAAQWAARARLRERGATTMLMGVRFVR